VTSAQQTTRDLNTDLKSTAANSAKPEAAVGKFEYPPHPIANIFPLLDPTSPEFLALVEDIKENDLREPITLHEDKILDGRNRYLALRISGREMTERHFKKYFGSDPIGFVLSANLHRRHLNESQRAMVGAKMASFEVGDNQHKLEGVSIDTASKLLNVGRASIARARKVLGFGDPETINQVVAGKLSVSKAAEQATRQAQAAMDEDDDEDDRSTEGSTEDDAADVEVLDEYDNLEGKLLTKLSDLSVVKAEEHSDITISKIKTQVAFMKKVAEKAAAKAAKGKAT
jgi:hypothetical protein